MEIVGDPFFSQALFIGDSITVGLEVHAAFDGRLLASVGLNLASATLEVSAFAHLDPRYIFILLGTNDMTNGNITPALFIDDYARLIATLGSYFPNAHILPQSILPVSYNYSAQEFVTNDRIDEFNRALQQLCFILGLTYVDVGALWRLPDGSLHPEVDGGDGLHIRFAYYGSWLYALREYGLWLESR